MSKELRAVWLTIFLVSYIQSTLSADLSVVRVSVSDKQDKDLLTKFAHENAIDFSAEENETPAELLIENNDLQNLVSQIPNAKIQNLTDGIEKNLKDSAHAASRSTRGFRGLSSQQEDVSYLNLNQIYNWLHTMLNRHRGRASLHEYGKSYEGRPLLVLKVNTGQGYPVVLVETGIHSREWLGPASNIQFAKKVLAGDDPQLNKYEIHILLMVNPDGYDYTHKHRHTMEGRFWRKNRRPVPNDHRCIGVDLNRNWDIKFGTVGVSRDCTKVIYCGEAPFSEPETKALSRYIKSVASRTLFYLSVHAYGQMVIIPYVYSATKKPADIARMTMVASAARAAIKRTSGKQYYIGNGQELGLGLVSSSTVDYIKEVIGIKYTYGFELSPRGANLGYRGFDPPTSMIVPSGNDLTAAIKAMLTASQQN